jgi:hypothetical protein
MVCAIYYVHTILRDIGCQFKVGSPDAFRGYPYLKCPASQQPERGR